MRLPLTRPLPAAPNPGRLAPVRPPMHSAGPARGALPHWHESSLELQRGLQVTEHFDSKELPDAAAR